MTCLTNAFSRFGLECDKLAAKLTHRWVPNDQKCGSYFRPMDPKGLKRCAVQNLVAIEAIAVYSPKSGGQNGNPGSTPAQMELHYLNQSVKLFLRQPLVQGYTRSGSRRAYSE
jgi:hypothetical protein